MPPSSCRCARQRSLSTCVLRSPRIRLHNHALRAVPPASPRGVPSAHAPGAAVGGTDSAVSVTVLGPTGFTVLGPTGAHGLLLVRGRTCAEWLAELASHSLRHSSAEEVDSARLVTRNANHLLRHLRALIRRTLALRLNGSRCCGGRSAAVHLRTPYCCAGGRAGGRAGGGGRGGGRLREGAGRAHVLLAATHSGRGGVAVGRRHSADEQQCIAPVGDAEPWRWRHVWLSCTPERAHAAVLGVPNGLSIAQ